MPPIEENDLFVLYRDDDSLRKVTIEEMKEEFGGGTPAGVIDPPVVITTPLDGAGLSTEKVTPAAEGITGVVESTTTGPVWSSGGYGEWENSNPLTKGFDGTNAWTRTNANRSAGVTFSSPLAVNSSLKLTAAKDTGNGSIEVQTGPSTWVDVSSQYSNGSATVQERELFQLGITSIYGVRLSHLITASQPRFSKIEVDGKILIDGDTVSTASLTYTTDKELSLLTAGQSMSQVPAYSPQTDLITNVSGNVLTFATDKDIENFRTGDVVQLKSTGNPAWNESQVWSSYFTQDGGAAFSEPAVNAFDGSLETRCNGQDQTFGILKLPAGVSLNTGSTGIQFALGKIGGSNMFTNYRWMLGDEFFGTTVNVPSNSTGYINLPGSENETINSTNVFKIKNETRGLSLGALKVDGKILVDPTAIKVVSTNKAARQITVDGGTWSNGDQLEAGPFTASGDYVSHTANTLELANVEGRWCVDNQGVGVKAESDAEYTDLGPGATDVKFTSANGAPLTAPFSGSNTTFASRIWSLASSADGNTYSAFTDYTDTSVAATQTGATEWQPPAGTLADNTYYKAKVTYTATGATNVTSPEISFKTASGTSPNAVMSGLRFDSARSTKLSRSGSGTGTISYWKKDTSVASPEWEYVHQTGAAFPAEIGAGYNGYMSEYYFVDGQALPPETFGKDFEGKWGPLDNATVKANVGDFGANGFYLPFDPSNTGVNYTNKLSLLNGASYVANQGPELAFNGQLVTTLGPNISTAIVQTATATLRLTFDNAVDIGTNSSCFMGADQAGSVLQLFDENGSQVGSNISIPQGGTLVTIPESAAVKYMQWNSNGSTGNGAGFAYLIINGVLLVDHNSIGVDDSGNENNFHDENFNVGNTSQVWSDTNPGPTAASFDGNLTTYASIPQNTIYTFSTPITFADKVEVCFVKNTSGWQVAPKLQGSAAVNFVSSPNDTSPVTIASGGGVLEGWQVQLSPETYPIGVAMFIIDGEILVDGSIQDTVTDTPVKNYAVLQSGTNSNLVGSGDLSYSGEAGTTYYYETDGVAKTGTAPITGLPSGTHNFGQQPFAGVGPQGNEQTLYQEFENWQAGGAYFYDENNQEVVRATHLRHRYGRDTADNRLGIYELTEQPSHQVIGYEKVGSKYKALRDYTPEVRTAQAETAVAQAETAAAEAQADLYLGYLRKAACMWVVDRIYEAGEVVEFNGKLYRALVNAVATTDTDPGDETDRWEDLGIEADS